MLVEFEFCSKLRPVIQNSWWQSEWDFFSFDGQRKNFDLLLIDRIYFFSKYGKFVDQSTWYGRPPVSGPPPRGDNFFLIKPPSPACPAEHVAPERAPWGVNFSSSSQ